MAYDSISLLTFVVLGMIRFSYNKSCHLTMLFRFFFSQFCGRVAYWLNELKHFEKNLLYLEADLPPGFNDFLENNCSY